MQEALPVTNDLQLAPSRSVRRVNQEIFFQPTIYAHLVHAVCVEALIAGSSGNSLTMDGDCESYAVQKLFLEQHWSRKRRSSGFHGFLLWC